MTAAFGPDEINQLDYALLQNGASSFYTDKAILAEDIEWLSRNRYRVIEVDVTSRRERGEVFEAIEERVDEWPTGYAANGSWDAFRDALVDLDFPEGGIAFLFRGFGDFAQQTRDGAESTLDAFEKASRDHLLFGRRLIVILEARTDVNLGPAGGRHPLLNRREWLARMARRLRPSP
ncbi:MAG: barstar family protein [Actinomycetota bacterium]